MYTCTCITILFAYRFPHSKPNEKTYIYNLKKAPISPFRQFHFLSGFATHKLTIYVIESYVEMKEAKKEKPTVAGHSKTLIHIYVYYVSISGSAIYVCSVYAFINVEYSCPFYALL